MSEGIIIACITASSAVVVAYIGRARRQNSREHGETSTRLDHAIHIMGRVEEKIDNHIEGHK